MLMRIIAFDEVSDVIDFINTQFTDRFTELGYEVFTIHMKHVAECLGELEKFIVGGVTFVFCINNSAFAFDKFLKMPFWDTVGAPLIDYLLDHPVSYTELLRSAPKVCFPICVDGNHPDYILKHCPNIENSGFLPLGGAEVADESSEEWKDRPIDVLFVGYSRNIGIPMDNFAAQLSRYMTENTDKTYEEAMDYCYSKYAARYIKGVDIETALVRYMSVAIEVMGSFRQKMVRTLVDSGIDVTVYGAMWDKEKDLMVNPHFHYMGVTTAENCIRIMHHTKIVLNCMPWFKDGSHDRIPNAMMAGAVSVTDPSRYLLEHFEDGKDLYYFDLRKIDELPELIRKIFDSPDENEALRKQAMDKAKAEHLWKYRADELLEIFSE